MLAAIAYAALSASPVWAEDSMLEVQQQNGIFYVTGGIGKDESDALRATQTNYNLRIMNADKAGHFSGDTRIVISDLQHNPLLDATSGPLFYANLPKGRYIVEGFTGEQSRKQTINVATKKTIHVRFMWPEDISDTTNY
jgi:hypothetical protein